MGRHTASAISFIALILFLLSSLAVGADGVAIRVATDGNDANSGLSWAAPKKTIQAAIDAAAQDGGELWVKAGIYLLNYENLITFRPGTRMYGGFKGWETSRDQRDWNANPTILDGQNQYTVIVAQDTSEQQCVVDGFTIRNGTTYQGWAGGIHCRRSNMLIQNNTIRGNMGGGIYCENGTQTITRNRIVSNQGTGIVCRSMNSLPASVGITHNLIAQNSSGVGAIQIMPYTATICGNTIVGNGGAYYSIVIDRSASVFENNIMAHNTGCVRWNSTPPSSVRSNCVYGNGGGPQYYGIPDPTGTNGNVSVNPGLASWREGDCHLTPGSPCIDAACTDSMPTSDLDGVPRPMDGDADNMAAPDMGAYEYADMPYVRRNCSDETGVGLAKVVVTALSMPGTLLPFGSPYSSVYVQNASRNAGIRVVVYGSCSEGQVLDIFGVIQTDSATGERYVAVHESWPRPTGEMLTAKPLLLRNGDFGGGDAGLQQGVWGRLKVKRPDGKLEYRWTACEDMNNIGLLVSTFGRVTHADYKSFYIDDGSALDDGSGHKGLKVSAPSKTIPPVGSFVKVTGISSCERSPWEWLIRVLRVRKQEDIQVL